MPSDLDPLADPRAAPRAEYEERLSHRRDEQARHARRADTLSHARLAVFVLGAALAWLAFFAGRLPAWTPFLALPFFIALVVRHDRTLRQARRAGRAVAFYEQGLRRLGDTWAESAVVTTGERFANAAHPFSGDLDLFGRGSLFALLCIARTRAGEECLAGWLLNPAAPDEARARQQAVDDLRQRLDLREDIAVLGDEVRTGAGRPARSRGIDAAALAAWGAAPTAQIPLIERIAAALLAALTASAAIAWVFGTSVWPLLALTVLGQAFAARRQQWVGDVLRAVETAGKDLDLLALLLARLEREAFDAPRLQGLSSVLSGQGEPPSRRIARLQSRIDLLSAQANPFFAPLAFLLLWRLQCAFAIEDWRREHGPLIAGWIEAAGQFEALSSLASYACENPADPFPEIVEDDGPLFEAQGLAHPLLPAARAVPNDVHLNEATRLLLVSGSNMSGKSTLLRSVGVNVVLALAGGTVRAAAVRLSPLTIGASLRTQDSLQSGVSRFYAEITRLRQIVESAGGDTPLLFLLDEILHGTNSHDRRIGAEAVIRSLLHRGGIGFVTTHDLALTQIAADPALSAANVHLEDQMGADGAMSFDYHLRPGVVEKSNAIALMRAVGLEV